MKILFNLGSLEKGGAERVVANLSNYLINQNDSISIVTTVKGETFYDLDKKISRYFLDNNEEIRKSKIKKNIIRVKNLKMLLKKIIPDIVVSFLPEPSYRILFLKLFNRKIKVIVSVRNDPKVEYKSILNRTVMKLLYPLADGFVFQTQEAREYFSKKIQKKSIIISNPLNEEFINAKINCNRQKIIINVGRLEEQKNQQLLIKSFEKISKEYPEYKLIIYGEGSLRKELEKLIKELKLEDKVFLPGNVDNIKDKLNEAEIFVLSSNYEGMPNALMEAMAMGLVCISTNCPCGGPKALIENDDNGILVNINNQKELINAIEKVLLNKKLSKKLSENAIKISDKINPTLINNEWKKYIHKKIK